jgi:hypothetical protein
MKLVFLPHVREGIVPTATAGVRAQASVGVRLESPGRQPRDVSRAMTLLGPGDVVSIDPRQVLRVTPSSGTRDAEPEFFPSIEFDAPDLPWSYSPLVPSGTRVPPWITLIVIEATSEVAIVPGQQGQSPLILRLPPAMASRELPDLADRWAWAHAQVACASTTDVAQTLANHPDRTLSRLLSPRRLLPFRAYIACVVPAFLSGRIAGLGRDPATEPTLVTGHEPAWSPSDVPSELPVYYSWSFRTGEAGDFESLAQRLHATPPDASIPTTPLHLSLPDGDTTLVVDWEPPLRVRGQQSSRTRRPAAAVQQIKSVLAASSSSRVLGPSYFGGPWIDGRPLTPRTQWAPELNLTPMSRAAASLGAEAVRGEQDALIAAASEQLEVFRAKQREGRRRQLAAAFENRVKLRLSAAPVTESARVFAPLAVSTQLTAASVGLLTTAGRRVLRGINVDREGLSRATTAGTIATTTGTVSAAPSILTPTTSRSSLIGSVLTRSDLPTLRIPGELAGVIADPVILQPTVVLEPVRDVPPPVTPVDATTIETGEFAPRFARPMSEPLAERFPELMLPGAGTIEPDGVMLVESDQAFVEAFLVGANQELNYEMLWRRLPADMRATAFRRFWGHADGSDDIDAITTWDANTAVGSHVKTSASMVLVVRSELVRRYPSLLVAAVPAAWDSQGNRAPVQNPPTMVLPAFRGRIGADVLYAGFSQPSITDAIGTKTPAGPAGWFFLLSENPGDPRFGLDPGIGSAPPTRATLSWGHLSPPPTTPYAPIGSFPNVSDAGFSAATATAANVAMLVRQRPFRAFLHASLLIRLDA